MTTNITGTASSKLSKAVLPGEVKLTKGEVIDLVIEKMREENLAQQRQVDLEIKKIYGTGKCHGAVALDMSEVMSLVKNGSASLHIDDYRGRDEVHITIPLEKGHRFTETVKQLKALRNKSNKLRDTLRQINDSKAKIKTEILTQMLKSTKEGMDILSQIEKFKVTMHQKLLSSFSTSR